MSELRAFMNEDLLLILPEECCDEIDMMEPALAGSFPNNVTSETPEPVAYWRECLVNDNDLLIQADEITPRFAADMFDEELLPKMKPLAEQTLALLRSIREKLDHLDKILDPSELANYWDAYSEMAETTYGNSFPLDPVTREPAIPEGIHHEMPGTEDIGRFQGEAHFGDGIGLSMAFQGAAHAADGVYGANKTAVSFGGAYGASPVTWAIIIVGAIGLSAVGFFFAHRWREEAERLERELTVLQEQADNQNLPER